MKRRYRLSPQATLDLLRVWQYFAKSGGLEIADRVESDLIAKIGMLAELPNLGHWRHDLTAAPVRFFLVHSHFIIYRPDSNPLQVVAIVHGNRDVKRLLRKLF